MQALETASDASPSLDLLRASGHMQHASAEVHQPSPALTGGFAAGPALGGSEYRFCILPAVPDDDEDLSACKMLVLRSYLAQRSQI